MNKMNKNHNNIILFFKPKFKRKLEDAVCRDIHLIIPNLYISLPHYDKICIESIINT